MTCFRNPVAMPIDNLVEQPERADNRIYADRFRVARDPGNVIQAQSVQASSTSYKRLVDRPEYRSGSLLSSVSLFDWCRNYRSGHFPDSPDSNPGTELFPPRI